MTETENRCDICVHRCVGEGYCRARRDGRPTGYGRVSSLALDPIEKKPLARFYPGTKILSVGGWGCNLRCPYCQNYEISQQPPDPDPERYLAPEEILTLAKRYRDAGNIGIAFTYNEPLVCIEYVRDAARLVHEAGMQVVLVTNGMATVATLETIAPYIDAMNIDLKGDAEFYHWVGGELKMVQEFICSACRSCHVELTTLIIPGHNDSDAGMETEAAWIAEHCGEETPLHVTRYFPRYRCDIPPTPVTTVQRLAGVARVRLRYVYEGNI